MVATLSGGAGCASDERDDAPSATRRPANGGEAVNAAPSWTTGVDTSTDAIVVRTGIATDDETSVRLVEELRIGEDAEDDDRALGDARFVLPGPGEYGSANGIVRLKDGRLVLWDPQNLRMALYDSLGRSVAHWRYSSTLGIDGWRGLLVDTADHVYALSSFRSVAVGREAYPGEREGYVVLDPHGEIRDSILRPSWLARPAVLISRMNGGAMIWDYVPFAAQPKWTVSPLGYVVTGMSDRYAITLHRAGRPLRIERALEPVSVTRREKSEAEAAVLADMRAVDKQWTWNGPAIPKVKPFFTDLRTSAEGRIWVERVVGGEPARQDSATAPTPILAPRGAGADRIAVRTTTQQEVHAFDVYSPEGFLLGTVPVPFRARITYMHGDHVWGVIVDDIGRSQVVRWRIEPSLAARDRAHARH